MEDDPYADPFAGPEQVDTNGLAAQWGEFLQKGGGSAIAQAGLQLMQAPNFGQNGMAQIGQAIGEGGEAYGRSVKVDQTEKILANKKAETASRQAAREERLGIAQERLNLQSQRQAGRGEDRGRGGSGNKFSIQDLYDREEIKDRRGIATVAEREAKFRVEKASELDSTDTASPYAKYRGKSLTDVQYELMQDAEFTKKARAIRGAGVGVDPLVAEARRVIDLGYPRGPVMERLRSELEKRRKAQGDAPAGAPEEGTE